MTKTRKPLFPSAGILLIAGSALKAILYMPGRYAGKGTPVLAFMAAAFSIAAGILFLLRKPRYASIPLLVTAILYILEWPINRNFRTNLSYFQLVSDIFIIALLILVGILGILFQKEAPVKPVFPGVLLGVFSCIAYLVYSGVAFFWYLGAAGLPYYLRQFFVVPGMIIWHIGMILAYYWITNANGEKKPHLRVPQRPAPLYDPRFAASGDMRFAPPSQQFPVQPMAPAQPIPPQGYMPPMAPAQPIPPQGYMPPMAPAQPVPPQGYMPPMTPAQPIPPQGYMPPMTPAQPIPPQGYMPPMAPAQPVPPQGYMPQQVPVQPMTPPQ